MYTTESLWAELDNLALEKEILKKQLKNIETKQEVLYDLINKSAIFNEDIIFPIATLLSHKNKRLFSPIIYKKYNPVFVYPQMDIEEIHIGIADAENVVKFKANEKEWRNDDLKEFFQSKKGYEFIEKKSEVVDCIKENKDTITGYYEYPDNRFDKGVVIFKFLLDEYNMKNSYPVKSSKCDFADYDYVQKYIKYLFDLQLQRDGKQLTLEEMDKALDEFVKLEEEKAKAKTKIPNKKVIS